MCSLHEQMKEHHLLLTLSMNSIQTRLRFQFDGVMNTAKKKLLINSTLKLFKKGHKQKMNTKKVELFLLHPL